MATPAQSPPWWDTDSIQLESMSVQVRHLDESLVSFLINAGKAHLALYGRALVLTSGNDGTHVAGSAHGKNKAVDLRSLDKSPEAEMLFCLVLGWFSRLYKVAVFDERFTAFPHWHCQTADSVGG